MFLDYSKCSNFYKKTVMICDVPLHEIIDPKTFFIYNTTMFFSVFFAAHVFYSKI
jgi:hypothetical protein